MGVEFVFFDVRDTLGYVDRRGHLVPFRPSTERLLNEVKKTIGLRVGVITNLPNDVSSDQGRKMLEDAGILPYLDPKGLVINHDARLEKPRAQVYEYAAKQVGVAVDRCLFVGENFSEVIGALSAGMHGLLKPFPPGGEFGFKPSFAGPATSTSSGRLFEVLLEEEHVIGKRITDAAARIAVDIAAGKDRLQAFGVLVYLLEKYIDPYHHRKEEDALFPLAMARGLPSALCERTLREHDQGRAYFRALSVALRRAQDGDKNALGEARLVLEAFVTLYRAHGPDENDHVFPELGKYLTDADDAVIVELMRRIGPADATPYLELVRSLEQGLGLGG